jgi:hypothetical protein
MYEPGQKKEYRSHSGFNSSETVPYFWHLANREALASPLCALSAVEYDNLPLQFYWDMAKQASDEARHAQYFLQTSLTLLPDLRGDVSLHAGCAWLSLAEFWSTGRGLPIPREGNLYESMLNADLIERLILMNYRTEMPAVGRITARIKSRFCQSHPQIADAYEFDRIDEASHGVIGKRWLERLLPNEDERLARLEESDLLRNVLILTSFCHHGGESMANLMRTYTSSQSAFRESSGLNLINPRD